MQLFYKIPWPRISYIEHLEPEFKEVLHTVFGAVHEWLGFTLVALFVLHIAVVVKHSWLDKQPVIDLDSALERRRAARTH